MSGKSEKRADEEQLLTASTACTRHPAALQQGESTAAEDGFPLFHLNFTGLWWEGNQEGRV